MPDLKTNKKIRHHPATLLFVEQFFDGTNTLQISKEAGIARGEFYPMDVASTVNLLIALLVGLLRQKGLKVMQIKGIKQTAVEFCRRSLVNKEFGCG